MSELQPSELSLSEKLHRHGNNCRLLELNWEQAHWILERYYYPNKPPEEVMTPQEWDMFWEGFHTGTDTEIKPID